MKWRCAFVGLLVLVGAGTCLGDSPTTLDRIQLAKMAYTRDIAEVHADCLRFLDGRERVARSRGDGRALGDVTALRQELETSKQLPLGVPRVFRTRARSAMTKLERVFDDAIKDALQSMNAGVAAQLKRERSQFLRPVDAVAFGDSFYKGFVSGISWEEAAERCEEMGGHLVVITSANENDFVTSLARKHSMERVWIGITDRVREGEWVWVTGERVSYSKWHRWSNGKSEPNDWMGEDFGSLDTNEPGEWHDTPSVVQSPDRRGFVCEWD